MSDSSDDMEFYSGCLDDDELEPEERIERLERVVLLLALELKDSHDLNNNLIRLLKEIESEYE